MAILQFSAKSDYWQHPLYHLDPLQPESTSFCNYYGMSKCKAWQELEAHINPLDWYLHKKQLLAPNVIRTKSQDDAFEHAFIATKTILSQIGVDRSEGAEMHGA